MPRGTIKDANQLREILETSVVLVGGEIVDNNSIDLNDDDPVVVGVIVNVNGHGRNPGAIAVAQGAHPDAALEAAHEILEDWENDHYGPDVSTETFDGWTFELAPQAFADAIEGTEAEKFIEIEEDGEGDEEGEHIDPDAYSVYNYDNNRQLPGSPTEELILASLDNDTGFAIAEYDPDESVWDLVSDEDADRIRRRGGQLRHVYVQKD